MIGPSGSGAVRHSLGILVLLRSRGLWYLPQAALVMLLNHLLANIGKPLRGFLRNLPPASAVEKRPNALPSELHDSLVDYD